MAESLASRHRADMILPGHLAAGYLAAHYARLDERIAVAAAMFPDLVDKVGRYVLHLTPSGRVPAHSLMLLIATTAVLWLLLRQPYSVLGWVVGYASHLAADVSIDLLQSSDSFPYLFWPFVPPRFSHYHTIFGSISDYTIWSVGLELAVSLWALIVVLRVWRERQRLRSTWQQGQLRSTRVKSDLK